MPTITFTRDSDGDDVVLPAKFEVCARCDGHGKHVNPNVNGHGLSAEDFHEDPDFADAYFAGRYDVRCEECNGQRVVPVVDEAQADPQDLSDYYEYLAAEARYRAAEAAERRYFGG